MLKLVVSRQWKVGSGKWKVSGPDPLLHHSNTPALRYFHSALSPRAAIAAFAVLACGCNHDTGAATEEATPAPPTVEVVGRPEVDRRTSLNLVRDGNEIGLGDTLDPFQEFPKPKSAFEFTDLPPGFQAPYSAKGWETAREGVGAILYGKSVVLLVRQLNRSSQDVLQEILDTVSKENPKIKPTVVQGNQVTYYFWDEQPQRIMVSALETKRGGWHITEALGDDTVMNALSMNPDQAKKDQPKVDRLLKTTKT